MGTNGQPNSEILYLVVDGLPHTMLPCTLTRKKIKNINLRITREGEVRASAPLHTPKKRILEFLQSHSRWAYELSQKAQQQTAALPPAPDKAAAEAILRPVFDRIYPDFASLLGNTPPTLLLREMKSRWGVCYPLQKKIVLNTRLALYPTAAQEYVVLHEFVHFIHPNHQAGFHREMAARMPDYTVRKRLLRQ